MRNISKNMYVAVPYISEHAFFPKAADCNTVTLLNVVYD